MAHMDFETARETNSFGEGRTKLLSLEKEGKYVFHGSSHALEILEPRQAHTYDENTDQMMKDGDPAVFATPYADVAIFRALIRSENVVGDSENKFGMKDDGTLHFTASRHLIDAAINKKAKIYVLDKTGFSEPQGTDVRIEQAVKPLMVIDVTADDLPKDITVVE